MGKVTRNRDEGRPDLLQMLQVIKNQDHWNHVRVLRVSEARLVQPIPETRIHGQETRMTVNEIEADLALAEKLIHLANQALQHEAALQFGVQRQSRGQGHAVGKSRTKIAHL